MKKWESEKHKSCGMPAGGFKCHVATHGSLLGLAGQSGACGWSVVQLDHDEELEPLHGMCGSMVAELEVQRTIKRAELTAFLCLLTKVIGPIKVHVDNKGIIDGLWRGERKCIDPQAGDADLWITNIWRRFAPSSLERNVDGSGARQRRTAQRKTRKRCRNLRSLSPMAMTKRMSWRRQVRLWTKDLWRKRSSAGARRGICSLAVRSKVRKRSIERSGVLRPTSIDA